MAWIDVAAAIWFFLPAFVANQCPGFAAYIRGPGRIPVSRTYLGENKTVDAYPAAVAGAIATFALQQALPEINISIGWYVTQDFSDICAIGTLFGIGAVLGDHVESFFKRRRGMPPGTIWWPWDSVDFAIGALVCIYPVSGWIGWDRIAILLGIAIALHPIVNWIGYRLGIRKQWL